MSTEHDTPAPIVCRDCGEATTGPVWIYQGEPICFAHYRPSWIRFPHAPEDYSAEDVMRRCPVCGRLNLWIRPVLQWHPGYCSTACQVEARKARRRRPSPAPRSCENCGDTFTPMRSDARYCSGRCREAAHRARQKEAAR